MTTIDDALPSPLGESAATAETRTQTATRSWWDRLEAGLERLGEHFNPILIKEARQALKSRQFAVTFTLVLACGWIWSMLGVALIGPTIHYAAEAPQIFYGYYIVLSFPLLIIVPFGAFRSLAAEREDGTYELLSISTLWPRQIISGKLGSAVLQMLVYFSAISPCLAFTYMLRGIDVPTIVFVLCLVFLASLGLSLVGLVVATATPERHWQVVLSVFLIAGLGFAFSLGCGLAWEILEHPNIGYQDHEFWIGAAAFITAYGSYFALLFCAASAQLTFSTDNRSTPLRVVMLAQQLLFTGWMTVPLFAYGEYEAVMVYMLLSGVHWYLMGAFMIGESGELSERVKRTLPQTFFGRAMLTWFNPGPATGYIFAVANLLAVLILGCFALTIGRLFIDPQGAWLNRNLEESLQFALLGFCYVTIYLGLGRLMIALLRKVGQVGMLLNILLQVLLLVAGTGVPLTLHLMSPVLRSNYSLIEISNPFWTLAQVVDGPMAADQIIVLLICLPAAALAVFLLNLLGVVTEVRHVRIAKPTRVEEEDTKLAAQLAPPPEPARTSPWD
jgi:hypothetical protein